MWFLIYNLLRTSRTEWVNQSPTYGSVTLEFAPNAPRAILGNWLIQSVAYDRQRLILQLEMKPGKRYQYFGVPRREAIGLVQADKPAQHREEFIQRTYRFERVRVPRVAIGAIPLPQYGPGDSS